VVADQSGRKIPTYTGVLEVADQFAFLSVDANDREASALETVMKITKTEELIIPSGTLVGGEFLAIDARGLPHLMEKASYGVGLTTTPKSPRAMAILSVVRRDHFRPEIGSPAVFFRPGCARRRNDGCGQGSRCDRVVGDVHWRRYADPGRGIRPEHDRRHAPA
jgi:hypothetical protein